MVFSGGKSGDTRHVIYYSGPSEGNREINRAVMSVSRNTRNCIIYGGGGAYCAVLYGGRVTICRDRTS